NPNTAQRPFHDGANSVAVCAIDFAGNRTCEERTVHVDNTAPAISFQSSHSRKAPELIRVPVSDPVSGVSSGRILYRPVGESTWRYLDTQLRGGELRARVDSTGNPPGQ